MAGTRDTRSDEGFGLVEVVVSMLLFAVIAVAILPLALQASVLSAGNRDRASAQAFAAARGCAGGASRRRSQLVHGTGRRRGDGRSR